MSDLDATTDRQGGRSTTMVVVLALVFLTVLGASVGVILAKNNTGDNTASPPFDAASSAPAQPAPGASKTPGTAVPSKGAYPATTMEQCPQQLKDALGISGLTVVRAIRTDVSEAWICKGGDKLYYQGHKLGHPFEKAMSDTSICLSNVTKDGDVYVATNNADGKTTKYLVARDYLQITENGTVKFNERGTDHWGQ
jgi:hypothetical protein